jgi:hypothetical protein
MVGRQTGESLNGKFVGASRRWGRPTDKDDDHPGQKHRP